MAKLTARTVQQPLEECFRRFRCSLPITIVASKDECAGGGGQPEEEEEEEEDEEDEEREEGGEGTTEEAWAEQRSRSQN